MKRRALFVEESPTSISGSSSIVSFMIIFNTISARGITINEAIDAIIKADDTNSLYRNGNEIYFNGNVDGHITDKAINKILRSEDFCTIRGTRPIIPKITESEINNLIYRDNYVKEWCLKNVPNIVSNGDNQITAFRKIYNYVISIPYNYESYNEKDGSEFQSAYSAIVENKAICASYSKLFRSMIEIIPFDDLGFVDWNNGKNYISVMLGWYDNGKIAHEWAAINTKIPAPLWALSSLDNEDLTKYYGNETTINFNFTYGNSGFGISTDFLINQLINVYPEMTKDKLDWFY